MSTRLKATNDTEIMKIKNINLRVGGRICCNTGAPFYAVWLRITGVGYEKNGNNVVDYVDMTRGSGVTLRIERRLLNDLNNKAWGHVLSHIFSDYL